MTVIKTEEAVDLTPIKTGKDEVVINVHNGEATLKVGNPSGLQPVEYKVLIKQDETEKVTDGGIVLPKETTEKEQWAEVKATLIAVGGKAFHDFGDPNPRPGDRVVVRQYAGYKIKGKDKIEYQVCNDKDITLIINEE